MSHWKVLKSIELLKARFFRLRSDQCQLPDGRVMPSYYVMEFPEWVNVVPVTDDGQMILVEQYRHAGEETFLEIPGGSTHDHGEEPRAAGERELLEETGYQAREWIHCGHHFPNPALQNNRMHTFLALGCRIVQEPHLDPFEDLTVEVRSIKEVIQLLHQGAIKHSLIAASLTLTLNELKTRFPQQF